MPPLISVVTICYNAKNDLEKTILSVLSQTYQDIEYIIIDGGSTDGTVDIIHKYSERLFYWISEPDKGIYDAMNKGIKMATGDIIGVLNSDDFFTHSDVLKKVVERFENDEALDAVYGDVHFVKSNNLNKCVRYYSSKIFRRKLMRLGFMPAHPSFYMRKRCFDEFGLYRTDYKIAADFEFLLRAIFKGNIKIEYMPVDMVTMRMGGASTSGMESHKRIMEEHLRAFRENGVYTNVFLLSLRYVYKIGELFFSFLH